MASLKEGIDALAAAIGADVKAVVAAVVPKTRTISAGTGLTGGGDLSANRTLAVTYGTGAGTAAEGNDARLSNPRTPTVGTSPYDLSIVGFGKDTVRAVGTGDNPFGIRLQRAVTFTAAVFRGATADASGSSTFQVYKNGSVVSGMAATVTAANQVAGGTPVTGSWAFAEGDILTIAPTALGTTPGKGLVADLKGTA